MTMGEYIKFLRMGGNKYGRKWSQEELGKLLEPPVYRSAVNKWELGRVVNIKRDYIEQLSELFGVEPHELMCFDSKYYEERISEEVKVIEQIQKVFGKDVVELIRYYNELNEEGKEKALTNIGDLTEIPKYTDSVKGE